ncbi:MAG: hypothetical protein ACTSRP_25985 [Candidatus Helarchaeota archaeon]
MVKRIVIKELDDTGHQILEMSPIEFMDSFPSDKVVIYNEKAIVDPSEFQEVLSRSVEEEIEVYVIPVLKGG